MPGDVRYLRDSPVEGGLVGRRRLGRPAYLPDVLQRGRVHLVIRRGWVEIVQGSNVATHVSRVAQRPAGSQTVTSRNRASLALGEAASMTEVAPDDVTWHNLGAIGEFDGIRTAHR
jgi:hypothetical protein